MILKYQKQNYVKTQKGELWPPMEALLVLSIIASNRKIYVVLTQKKKKNN